jgi:hypothetical protein
MFTGEIIAFVTSGISLLPGTILDGAHAAQTGGSIRQAAFTPEVLYGHTFKTRQFLLVYRQQSFQELLIVVTGC